MRVCLECGEVYPAGATLCRVCRSDESGLLEWGAATTELRGLQSAEGDLYEESEVGATPTQVTDVEQKPWQSASFLSEDTPIIPRIEGANRTSGAPKSGRLLDGRYRLKEQIGIGGYGVVFSAMDERLQKRVAIKILSPAVAQHATVLARFRQEAIAASSVRHENIVEIFDFGADASGVHFIVMEYLAGTDLSAVLRTEGCVAPDRAAAIVSQCAKGLSQVHAVGILHRDLKPSNIFLTSNDGSPEVVKIIDFGISKVLRGQDLTSASSVVGTPDYMAPEQADAASPDGRSDVYALGVIFFELLTGKRPFSGRAPLETLEKHATKPRPRPSHRRSELAGLEKLDALVMRMMAIVPQDRPLMEELVDEAAACEHELSSMGVTAVSAFLPEPSPRAPTHRVQRPMRVARRPSRRVVATSLGAAAAVATLLVALLGRNSPKDAPRSESVQEPAEASAMNTGSPARVEPAAKPQTKVAIPDPVRSSEQRVQAKPDAKKPLPVKMAASEAVAKKRTTPKKTNAKKAPPVPAKRANPRKRKVVKANKKKKLPPTQPLRGNKPKVSSKVKPAESPKKIGTIREW